MYSPWSMNGPGLRHVVVCAGVRQELLPARPVHPQERHGEARLALHTGRVATVTHQQRPNAHRRIRA